MAGKSSFFCCVGTTIGFVSGRKLQRSQGQLWWPQRKLRRPQGKLQRPETERDIYDRGSCPRAQSRRLPELPFAHLHPSIVAQLLWWGFSRLRIINVYLKITRKGTCENSYYSKISNVEMHGHATVTTK